MKRWLTGAVIALCVAGGGIAVDLTLLHYRLLFGAPGGGACGPLGGCAEVVGSVYGQWLGVPLSVFGLCFYLLAAALAIAALLAPERAAPALRALGGLAALALAIDLGLAWISWARLGRFCPLCVLSYAIHLAIVSSTIVLMRLTHTAWLGALPGWPRLDAPRTLRDRGTLAAVIPALAAALAVAMLGAAGSLAAVARNVERENRAGLLAYLRTAEPVTVDAGGSAAWGAPRAPVTLVVFSDLMCEQCAALARSLEILAASHRDSVRIVYRHFPMEASCNPVRASSSPHPGACALARAAECAARQGRFREFLAAAHADASIPQPERIEAYASRAGLDLDAFRACANDPSSLDAVRREVALGESLGVTATPTTFVNGRAVVGPFKAWLWDDMVRAVPRTSPEATALHTTDRNETGAATGVGRR